MHPGLQHPAQRRQIPGGGQPGGGLRPPRPPHPIGGRGFPPRPPGTCFRPCVPTRPDRSPAQRRGSGFWEARPQHAADHAPAEPVTDAQGHLRRHRHGSGLPLTHGILPAIGEVGL
ncbi:MAG: hypothetical protein M3Y08_05745 [Fibrobacterota bacterium]|nr:hypothetical protein [Fibrobacterota bacterium]